MIKAILKFAILLILLPSCKKEDDPEIDPPLPVFDSCRVVEVRNQNNKLVNTYLYNTDKKPVKITSYEMDAIYGITNITYKGDSVISEYNDPYYGTFIMKCKLINGRAEKEINIYLDNTNTLTQLDTITNEYDSEGYLIKQRCLQYNISPNDTTTNHHTFVCTISNGNKTSDTKTWDYNPTISITNNYEYYTDQQNKSQIDQSGMPSYGLNLQGKLNKNPIKKNISSLGYTIYEYNHSGFVSKKTNIANDGITVSQVFIFIYACE